MAREASKLLHIDLVVVMVVVVCMVEGGHGGLGRALAAAVGEDGYGQVGASGAFAIENNKKKGIKCLASRLVKSSCNSGVARLDVVWRRDDDPGV